MVFHLSLWRHLPVCSAGRDEIFGCLSLTNRRRSQFRHRLIFHPSPSSSFHLLFISPSPSFTVVLPRPPAWLRSRHIKPTHDFTFSLPSIATSRVPSLYRASFRSLCFRRVIPPIHLQTQTSPRNTGLKRHDDDDDDDDDPSSATHPCLRLIIPFLSPSQTEKSGNTSQDPHPSCLSFTSLHTHRYSNLTAGSPPSSTPSILRPLLRLSPSPLFVLMSFTILFMLLYWGVPFR